MPVSGLQRHQRRRHCWVRSRAEPAKLCGEVGGPQAFGRQGFFKFLYTEKVIKNNPTTDILTPKQEKPLPKYLTPEEVRLLIDTAAAAESPAQRRLAAMLELMYACGLRVSELVCLPESCIDFDKKQILVRGKGSKERLIPIAGAAVDAISEYLNIREEFIRGGRKSIWLFPSRSSREGHITRDAFLKISKKLPLRQEFRRCGFHLTCCAIRLRRIC